VSLTCVFSEDFSNLSESFSDNPIKKENRARNIYVFFLKKPLKKKFEEDVSFEN
jgi:hypothetical protein